jgi:hypothetical protein
LSTSRKSSTAIAGYGDASTALGLLAAGIPAQDFWSFVNCESGEIEIVN